MKEHGRQLNFELITGASGDYDYSWASNGGQLFCSDYSRLYLLESGEAEITIDAERYVLKPGRLFLIPCFTSAYYKCTKTMRLNWLHFRIEHLWGMDIFSSLEPVYRGPVDFNPLTEFNNLICMITGGSPIEYFSAVGIFADLIKPFLPQSWDDFIPDSKEAIRLGVALEYIRANYPKNDITLKYLAGLVHLHPTYFSNLFKSTFKNSPMQYLIEVRLRNARTLLLTSAMNISEIAEKCGYNDPFFFTRIFKKNTGITPREFRKSNGVFE